MKKYIFSIIGMIIIIFSLSTNVYATVIPTVKIKGLDTPYVGEQIDRTASVYQGNCKVKDIIWYQNSSRVYADTYENKGEYVCKIYFTVDAGYEIVAKTKFSVVGFEDSDDIIRGQDYNGNFIELKYNVKNRPSGIPSVIQFSGLSTPQYNQKFDYQVISENPDYYNCSKVEWYKDGNLLSKDAVASDGEYVGRVYLNLYNGLTMKPTLKVYLGTKRMEVIQTSNSIYFETTLVAKVTEDNKELKEVEILIKEIPTYGQAVSKVNIKEKRDSKYFNITSVEWYRDGYRMLDDYFYEGVYKCRVYFEFVNGGYPGSKFEINTSTSTDSKKYTLLNGRYYFEETFNIKKADSSTFKFDDLNIPVYGGVQDTKINSIEPGLYTPSIVYWYKDGKYMSNIETFSEGTYKCKFSLVINPEYKVPNTLKATINGQKANVYWENNKITIDKTYEVKVPTKTWTVASNWAIPELNDALNNALIPTILNNKNYTQNITRAEFAAVAVKLYERLALKTATPIANNPFTDTSDSEILKAYALGITNGTSTTTFSPQNLITRQEMATMMVRALDKAGVSTSVNLNNVKKFTDHDKIDNWALNGVYFMSNVGIIKGKGNNTFDVLGNATREEALAISIRSVNKYK